MRGAPLSWWGGERPLVTGNKRKDSPKSTEKELVLLFPYMGILLRKRDDKSQLVKAGKALRQH